jgi:hypothetical protein
MFKIGQKIKVNKDGAIIHGVVKDIKRSYGHENVLVTTGKAEDFWSRNAKPAK